MQKNIKRVQKKKPAAYQSLVDLYMIFPAVAALVLVREENFKAVLTKTARCQRRAGVAYVGLSSRAAKINNTTRADRPMNGWTNSKSQRHCLRMPWVISWKPFDFATFSTSVSWDSIWNHRFLHHRSAAAAFVVVVVVFAAAAAAVLPIGGDDDGGGDGSPSLSIRPCRARARAEGATPCLRGETPHLRFGARTRESGRPNLPARRSPSTRTPSAPRRSTRASSREGPKACSGRR